MPQRSIALFPPFADGLFGRAPHVQKAWGARFVSPHRKWAQESKTSIPSSVNGAFVREANFVGEKPYPLWTGHLSLAGVPNACRSRVIPRQQRLRSKNIRPPRCARVPAGPAVAAACWRGTPSSIRVDDVDPPALGVAV